MNNPSHCYDALIPISNLEQISEIKTLQIYYRFIICYLLFVWYNHLLLLLLLLISREEN